MFGHRKGKSTAAGRVPLRARGSTGAPYEHVAPVWLACAASPSPASFGIAEKKILTALPKMARAARDQKLKAAFEKHHAETETQASRLERVFRAIDAKPQGKTCDAIMGLVEEGQEIMKEYKGSPALDAGLLAAAQAVEHYEISRYGTLRTWAEELGLAEAVMLLEATLREEKATDETLTQIAETVVNQEAQVQDAA
jgi:ferritin-like metal-binding protein YciE